MILFFIYAFIFGNLIFYLFLKLKTFSFTINNIFDDYPIKKIFPSINQTNYNILLFQL